MTKFLKIAIGTLLLGVALLIAYIGFSDHNTYQGTYAPDGTYCDYGYKQATEQCCDDDDYSCELCIRHGIYCNEKSMIQDFFDIDHLPPGVNYDCGDFSNWEVAQKVFIRDGGPKKDTHSLDRDGDGVACESLKK